MKPIPFFFLQIYCAFWIHFEIRRLDCPYLDVKITWFYHPHFQSQDDSKFQILIMNYEHLTHTSVQFTSLAQSCLTLCNPTNSSTPSLPVHHQLPESTQTHVHQVDDAIQPSHPLLSPSLPALNLLQHQGLFQWVSSSHEVAKVLEFQLQHQFFQWIFRTDFL